MIVAASTEHPNSAWVVSQTDCFLDQTMDRAEKTSIVMYDRDAKFTKEFVETLKTCGVRHNALPKAAPNLNGRCERAILTLKKRSVCRSSSSSAIAISIMSSASS